MSRSILVVDDEPTMRESLEDFLRSEGYAVATAGSGTDALRRLERERFDAIIADIVLPDLSGLEVLERSRALRPSAAVILITGRASVESAVEALRKGADDYLRKPFLLDDLGAALRRVLEPRGADPAGPGRARPSGAGADAWLVGESPRMRAVREQIARCAATVGTVLVTGESGTGKELVARAVHAAGPRRDGPFVPVNCGAIPETLLESQLFGHVRGAFTGAIHASPGLFAAAAGGTLFLDEIGELPAPLQVKLLRVIEEKQVWPVGATRPVPVDVRIVASTNRDLPGEVAAGRFRADLFYRLDVLQIRLPPLRERRGDIPRLVEHFLGRIAARLGRPCPRLDTAALGVLVNHEWPGNVRELANVLERAMVQADGDLIRPADLSAEVAQDAGDPPADLRAAVRLFERRHIEAAVAAAGADKREAARRLGISLASLYRKLGGAEPRPGGGGAARSGCPGDSLPGPHSPRMTPSSARQPARTVVPSGRSEPVRSFGWSARRRRPAPHATR